jgi:hypothetical protein
LEKTNIKRYFVLLFLGIDKKVKQLIKRRKNAFISTRKIFEFFNGQGLVRKIMVGLFSLREITKKKKYFFRLHTPSS